jgi:hypothetical protein
VDRGWIKGAVHDNGDKQLRRIAYRRTPETFSRHAYHLKAPAIQQNIATHHVGVFSEGPFPKRVAQDRIWMRPFLFVVRRIKQPTDRRLNPQYLEVISAHHRQRDKPRWPPLPAEAYWTLAARESDESCIGPVFVANIAVVWIAEPDARPGGIPCQDDQFLRILHRQPAQQDGINQSKDGCVGPDAQRQREHRHSGKNGTLS